MGLKLKVKVSGVSNLHEARYCAGMGVEMLGICLDKNKPEFVTTETLKILKTWVSGVKFIGEGEVGKDIIDQYDLDYMEVQNKFIKGSNSYHLPICCRYIYDIKKSKIDTLVHLKTYQKAVEYFFVVSKFNEMVVEKLAFLSQHLPIFLSTDIDTENLDLILHEIKPQGLILLGSTEIKTGLNNFETLANILEKLEI